MDGFWFVVWTLLGVVMIGTIIARFTRYPGPILQSCTKRWTTIPKVIIVVVGTFMGSMLLVALLLRFVFKVW